MLLTIPPTHPFPHSQIFSIAPDEDEVVGFHYFDKVRWEARYAQFATPGPRPYPTGSRGPFAR